MPTPRPRFSVAVFGAQDIDLLLIPVHPSFAEMGEDAQAAVVSEMQSRATSLDLNGVVVPAWQTADGRTWFHAPPHLLSQLAGMDMRWINGHITRQLFW